MAGFGRMEPGDPTRLGAETDEEGASFALFSSGAERVELQIFDPSGGGPSGDGDRKSVV